MARVRLTSTHSINGKQVKAGTIVCDGNSCQAGDVVWTGLNSTTFSNRMSALDAGATTIQNASRFTSGSQPACITGCESIEA
jgi:hypothetical protein